MRTPYPVLVALVLVGCDAHPGASDAAAIEDAAIEDAAIDATALGPLCDPRAPACGPGAKCTTTRWRLDQPWPAPRCAALGAGTRGGVCFAVEGVFDGCDADHACTSFGTGEGFCVPICGPDVACGEAGDACVEVDPASGFALCMTRCALDGDCPGSLVCVERGGVRVCDAAHG
ncbi:MAG: hypothetical protein R3B82_16840 [Sandaracinaceae bacterium]